MALDSYANLQASIMDWLARPADPLISGVIPDLILMFEEEARDRLKTRFNEVKGSILPLPNSDTTPLPLDYYQMRRVWITESWGNADLLYQTPTNLDSMWSLQGNQAAYTVEGLNLRTVGNSGDTPSPINIDYQQGITGLSSAVPTNWLLANYPSLYLFGSLVFAEPYIGDDPRIALWVQQREATFERVQLTDRKARWPGGSLCIQTDTGNP